jgi:hypothetical protein
MEFQSDVSFQIGLAREYAWIGDILVAKAGRPQDPGEAEALIRDAIAQYKNVTGSSLCRDVFAPTNGIAEMKSLQEKVKTKLAPLEAVVR